MYLLDTDILIDIQRGHPPALTWFTSLPELPSIPGFVVKKKGRRQKAEGRRYKTIQWRLEPPLIEDHQPAVWWGHVLVLGKARQRA